MAEQGSPQKLREVIKEVNISDLFDVESTALTVNEKQFDPYKTDHKSTVQVNIFFGPIIRKLWAETYLHYPFNFVLLPKLFQFSQIITYLFISSFAIGLVSGIIQSLNDDKKVEDMTIGPVVLDSQREWFQRVICIYPGAHTQELEFSLIMDGEIIYREKTSVNYPLLHLWIDVEESIQ